MIICGTGHRPNKLGGYGKPAFNRLASAAYAWLVENKPDLVISGMALGWDQALACAALKAGIEVHAYVPCLGHSNLWPEPSREFYDRILRRCSVVWIPDIPYSRDAMLQRNKDMVNASDSVLAMWDGSHGGTGNCVAYATRKGVPIINLYNKTFSV